jgi:hypothetical protein
MRSDWRASLFAVAAYSQGFSRLFSGFLGIPKIDEKVQKQTTTWQTGQNNVP